MRLEIVNPANWMPRVFDLVSANWAETGFDFPFDPDIQAYKAAYEAGLCFAVAAFVDEEVVGYCTVGVIRHPHSKGVIFASNDALFVKPEYRSGLIPGRLIATAETEAKRRGAVRFTWHCRIGTTLAEMLIKHGYRSVDETVMRTL